ncbi:PREDICTED: pentatricopeptide repeat-containing [Prunus dulcis]|uniref:PREDICTED: pentatricopeptide repeat-containing n=1 Tax=Prunus dulcis TaxID=3755 RepID=A0A5E4ERU6_PRUDU|nr:PREDICTED: pentatricopeptide repeat-containing [Prunus dulcis]
MARGNHGMNACSFHPILNVVMEEAWAVVDLMRRLGAPLDLTAYNYLLMAYCFSGDLDLTAAVLKRIEEKGMSADTRTYDALVLDAARRGRWRGLWCC